MSKFPKPPKEVKVQAALDGLAPQFRKALEKTVARMVVLGHKPRIFETVRTAERQAFLYGFGRKYDDGRGVVTNSQSNLKTWHGYGLAADIVEDDATPWNATSAFWNDLGACAEACGLEWGGRWRFLDLPHVQWGKCRRSPSQVAINALAKHGVAEVWRLCRAR
jgi:hypothetical protein